MELIYTFTDDERRFASEARAEYFTALQFIAKLHQITGALEVAPDCSGFVRSAPPATQPPIEDDRDR